MVNETNTRFPPSRQGLDYLGAALLRIDDCRWSIEEEAVSYQRSVLSSEVILARFLLLPADG